MAGSRDAGSTAARATVIATGATLAGYAASLLQWAVYARVLGVSASTDALAAALAWLVAASGLVGATFVSVTVPLYLGAAVNNPAAARDLFRTANTVALGFGLFIAVLTLAGAQALASLLLPGATESSRKELTDILRVASPLGVLWVAVHTLSSLANARERYGQAAVATLIPSIPVIAALVLAPVPSVLQVAAAFVAGLALEAAALLATVWPWRRDLVPGLSTAALRRLGRAAAPVVAAFVLLNLSTIALRAIASFGGPGDVSVVDYAIRIVTATETVLLSGALAVVLTVWSVDAAGTGPERLPVPTTLRAALGFIVPAASAVGLLAPAIVAVLFGGGRFDASDVEDVSRFLLWITVGLAAHALYLVVVRALLAQGRTMAFLGSSAIQIGALTIAAWALVGGLGMVGLATAYSASWLLAFIVAVTRLEALRETAAALGIEAGRSLLAGLVPGALAALALGALPADPLSRLVLGGAVFAVGWLIVGRFVGLTAVQATLGSLPRLSSAGLRRP